MTFCFQRAVAATVFQLSSQNQDHQFFKSKKVECCFWHFPKFLLLRGVIWRPREEHFGRTPCIYKIKLIEKTQYVSILYSYKTIVKLTVPIIQIICPRICFQIRHCTISGRFDYQCKDYASVYSSGCTQQNDLQCIQL